MTKKPNNRSSLWYWAVLGLLPLSAPFFLSSSQSSKLSSSKSSSSKSSSNKFEITESTPSPKNLIPQKGTEFQNPQISPSEIESISASSTAPRETSVLSEVPSPQKKSSLQGSFSSQPSSYLELGSQTNGVASHELADTQSPLAQPSSNPLSNQTSQSIVTNSKNSKEDHAPDLGLKPIRLKEAEKLDRVSLSPYKGAESVVERPPALDTPQLKLLSVKPAGTQPEVDFLSPKERLLASNPPALRSTNASRPNPAQEKEVENNEDDPPPFPSADERNGGKGGTQLPLAKPYCFLLPKSSPALKCAMESVKLIVDEYAKADVHVVPVFRWWGDDYSDDPGQLEEQAKKACNLQNAFPWIQGGNKTGSIQVFTRDPIPTLQCKKKYPEDKVSGCSNICPTDSPSFSTVSEAQCSAGTALHESGHSNCCAAKCKNKGDCNPKPEIDAGCGLCLQASSNFFEKRTFASKAPKDCQLTAAALDSIRAGASPNPGYAYDPNRNYKPRGKKLDSIFGKKGIKKLLRGVGDKADPDEFGEGEGTPMSSDDGSSTSRKRAPSSTKKGAQEEGEDPVVPGQSQKMYDNVEKMTQ